MVDLVLPAPKRRLPSSRHLARDLKTVGRFIAVYCEGCCGHERAEAVREPTLVRLDLTDKPIEIGPFNLCDDCRKLLTHAVVKRSHCPMDPKPWCKNCPNHCYHPTYRQRIREVMRYSGRKIMLRGRVDYLLHMLG